MLLSMHKLLFCIPLVGLFVTGGPLFAQQSYNPYQSNSMAPRMNAIGTNPAGSNFQPPLRWRPLESETGSSGSLSERHAVTPPSAVYDYTDEPFGLPRGTYRNIEQRHTITPHHEGFRFRPIDPGEQQRNRERNLSSAQRRQENMAPPVVPPNGFAEGNPQGMQPPVLKFRPDARLEKKSRGAPSRYSLPMGSSAPVYRPR